MKQALVSMTGVTLNMILFATSLYILLFLRPINIVALISAVLCPIAMTLRYRGIKLGRWLCLLNGVYLLVFYSTSLSLPFITRSQIAVSPQELLVAVLGTASSFLLLLHCAIFDKAQTPAGTRESE